MNKLQNIKMTHWKRLSDQIENLNLLKILDLGSGRGSFLIDAIAQGASIVGVEINKEYIDYSYKAAKNAGVHIKVIKGMAERLPFPNESFDFVNISEVIEHVESPLLLLKEVYRILRPGGQAYLSVPNRFGLKDQHFHLYLINWLPRIFANTFISIFGRHKEYKNCNTGYQNLVSMHYYTFSRIVVLLQENHFDVTDIRAKRISEFTGMKRLLIKLVYPILRTVYFDSFHLIISKNNII